VNVLGQLLSAVGFEPNWASGPGLEDDMWDEDENHGRTSQLDCGHFTTLLRCIRCRRFVVSTTVVSFLCHHMSPRFSVQA